MYPKVERFTAIKVYADESQNVLEKKKPSNNICGSIPVLQSSKQARKEPIVLMRPVLPLERRIMTMRGDKGGFWGHGNNLFHDLGNGCMNLLT